MQVLDRLPLRGDETVLDAGCGSGRLTERLLERLPAGRVVALAASPAMLTEARRRLARFGQRVAFVTRQATASRLTANGFDDVETWLSYKPTRFEPGEPFETYLETICLARRTAGLPK